MLRALLPSPRRSKNLGHLPLMVELLSLHEKKRCHLNSEALLTSSHVALPGLPVSRCVTLWHIGARPERDSCFRPVILGSAESLIQVRG